MADLLSRSALPISACPPHYSELSCGGFPYIRSELFANTPITVFADDREPLSVARDLAEIKTAQGDNFPFYVMDMGRVEWLLEEWRAHLPRVQPFYSLRCNSDPVLLRLLLEQSDVGFYCTNRSEVNLALEMVERDRILYANPLWTRGSVRHASENHLPLLMFESEEDLFRIQASYPQANLVLRVCLNPAVDEQSMRVGCNAFEEAPALLEMAARANISIVGISFSIGAGEPSLGIYRHAIAHARRLFDVGIAVGHPMCVLDVGGGFMGRADSARGPSFVQVASVLTAALDECFPLCSFPELRVIAEPGRYFASSTFALVTNIIDKRAVDASMVTNDAFDEGSAGFVYQTNEGFFGSFGCRLFPHCEPQCRPLLDFDDNIHSSTYATILGPTLSNGDIVQPITRLPQMQVGEWLLWNDMGAYSMSNRETLGADGPQAPTVYYFVGNDRWQHISRPTSPERASSSQDLEGEEAVEQVDCRSMESTDTESVLTDDEPLWLLSGALFVD